MSQKNGVCDGDMVLLERPDQTSRSLASARYSLERELCGTNSSTHLVVLDSILRVTFLGGAPLGGNTAGFLGKFKAWSSSRQSEIFHVSCSGTDPASTLQTTTKPSRLSEWRRSRHIGGAAKSRGHVGEVSFPQPDEAGGVSSGAAAGGGASVVEENQESESNPGVLSGVVASLASVILIMASVGALIFYRRHKKRLRERVEESEYAEYQPQSYYDGVKIREGKVGGHSGDSKRFSQALSAASKRWSDSRLAEYGLMLVRVLGGQHQARDAVPDKRSRPGRAGHAQVDVATAAAAAVDGEDGVRGDPDTVSESSSQAQVYRLAPCDVAEETKHVKCFAEIHRSLKPLTRRAPRPPLRPPPILDKANSSTTPAIGSHNLVAPPRRSKTRNVYNDEFADSASDSAYDNVLDQDNATVTTPEKDESLHSSINITKTSDSRTDRSKVEDETRMDTTPDLIIAQQDGEGLNSSSKAPPQADSPQGVSKDFGATGKRKVSPKLSERNDFLKKRNQDKAMKDVEVKAVGEEDIHNDGSDIISDEEEIYTSINELNEALYNLEQEVRDL
ncbi:hypothetical protein ElyMa_002026100 [Elysia marginata]|uniref:CUB domain-containing protein n=1 Tax=Elysia marginata TaxID=1093978 RepID=A0AAV4F6H5_9GAST|nr:hypothetical protein ElyMa_002026100 [Elysia marginata]